MNEIAQADQLLISQVYTHQNKTNICYPENIMLS